MASSGFHVLYCIWAHGSCLLIPWQQSSKGCMSSSWQHCPVEPSRKQIYKSYRNVQEAMNKSHKDREESSSYTVETWMYRTVREIKYC